MHSLIIAMEKIKKGVNNMTEKYNGWRNRFTWLCNLHLENDEALYTDIMNYIKDLKNEVDENEEIIYHLENYIYTLVTVRNAPEEINSLIDDLLGHAIAEIDFFEIAKNFLEE